MSEIDTPHKTSPFGTFHWFLGVVEDRNDPEKAGRVRVRCFGVHSDSTEEVPTDQLPWALVAVSATSGAGIGRSPTGIVPGSMVFGFFMDGKYAQQPVVLGSIFTMPSSEAVMPGGGFKDPEDKWPRYKDEPEVSRVARGTPIETRPGADAAIGAPASAYAAKYPFNKVFESETGHVIEVDDTEGAERIMVFHRTGSFVEFYPDGTIVSHAAKDQFRTVMGNDALHVAGNVKVVVDGNADVQVKGNADVKVAGNASVKVDGNAAADVKGSVKVKSGGNMDLDGKAINIRASGSVSIKSSSIKLNGTVSASPPIPTSATVAKT